MGRKLKGIRNKELGRLIKNFSKNLRELRTSKGLTLQSLASLAKMSTSTVWELENAIAEDFRMSTLTAIAEQLEIDSLKLLCDPEQSGVESEMGVDSKLDEA